MSGGLYAKYKGLMPSQDILDKLNEDPFFEQRFRQEYLGEWVKPEPKLLVTADDFIYFFRSNRVETFRIRIYNKTGVLVISVPNIYQIDRRFLTEFYKVRPASMGVYFRSEEGLRSYTIEEITLPEHSFPYTKDYATIDDLLNPPNSLRFVMED